MNNIFIPFIASKLTLAPGVSAITGQVTAWAMLDILQTALSRSTDLETIWTSPSYDVHLHNSKLCSITTSQRRVSFNQLASDPSVSANPASSSTMMIKPEQNRLTVFVTSDYSGRPIFPKAVLGLFKEMVTDFLEYFHEGEVSREVEEGTSIVIDDVAQQVRLELTILSFGPPADPLEWQDIVNGLLLMLAKPAAESRWETMTSEFSRGQNIFAEVNLEYYQDSNDTKTLGPKENMQVN